VEQKSDHGVLVRARYSAIFSNWILFRRQLVNVGLLEGRNVTLDLSETAVVDHSVMEKLHELAREFGHAGARLEIVGLDGHVQVSRHKHAARKRARERVKVISIDGSGEDNGTDTSDAAPPNRHRPK
jgi:MFS superfamily sulfate permease-like transporter